MTISTLHLRISTPNPLARLGLAAALVAAPAGCGDDTGASGSGSASAASESEGATTTAGGPVSDSATTTTTGAGSMGDSATVASTSSSSISDGSGDPSTATTATSEASTSSTGVDSSSTSGPETTTTTGTSGEPTSTGLVTDTDTGSGTDSESDAGTDTDPDGCVIADVEDTLAFNYVKTIDLVDINTIQASYYNIKDQEIVFFSYYGKGRRFSIDGQPLGDVMAPAEALPKLDGASYDQVGEVALLLTQECRLVEADPVTLQALKSIQLDTAKFKIGVCAGVAIGVDGHMYVISWQTEEMVKMTRDGQTELARLDLAALDLSRPDGISLIAGSENFLVLSSQKQQAAIITPAGAIVVPPGPVGKDVPPFKGGMIPNSDASLTVCGNGHAWLCEEYGTRCHDFAPEDGDKDACTCTLPQ